MSIERTQMCTNAQRFARKELVGEERILKQGTINYCTR